jgi:hypothetical protein
VRPSLRAGVSRGISPARLARRNDRPWPLRVFGTSGETPTCRESRWTGRGGFPPVFASGPPSNRLHRF